MFQKLLYKTKSFLSEVLSSFFSGMPGRVAELSDTSIHGTYIGFSLIAASQGASFKESKFEFSIEKTKNLWGYGRNGRVILSDKAPSYPQIKMRVPVSDNIDFVYFHADLNSNVLDSVRSYFTHSSSLVDFYRPVNRLKFMAAHQMEF
ncbi:MAG: hypothetical protein HYT94_00395, partial [Parcubacteria group bacterium]|nr:hypothetical protein [Parcubacteria group bacterium]